MAVCQIEHRVIFADTDAMGIVYHANYFRYFERARSEWFRLFYKTPNQMIEDENYLIIIKSHCNHYTPAKYEDIIVVDCWVRKDMVRAASLRFEFEVTRKSDGARIVTGYTTHTITDPDGKLKRMPREFSNALKDLSEDRAIENDDHR